MKTKITSLFIMLLIGYSSALAGIPGPPKTKKSTDEAIRVQVQYPGFAIEQGLEGDVFIQVKVEEDGSIDVVESNSCCPQLKNYVVGLLHSMSFNPEEYQTCCTYNLKFSFILR